MQAAPPSGPTGPVTPPSACSVPDELPAPDCEVLDQLLALARHYLLSEQRRQAMDILWSLLERQFHTTQGRVARAELLELAQRYDAEGARHIARGIYERLLCIEREGGHEER